MRRSTPEYREQERIRGKQRRDRMRFGLPSRDRAHLKLALYAMQNGRCASCMESVDFMDIQIDHYIPLARGGADVEDNIRFLLCPACNAHKGLKMPDAV